MYDVVALGELLVDFTPYGNSEHNNPCFERNPGGWTSQYGMYHWKTRRKGCISFTSRK